MNFCEKSKGLFWGTSPIALDCNISLLLFKQYACSYYSLLLYSSYLCSPYSSFFSNSQTHQYQLNMLKFLKLQLSYIVDQFFCIQQPTVNHAKEVTFDIQKSRGVIQSQQKLNSSLHSFLKQCLRIPLRVQSYFWLYGLMAIYTTLKTIVCIPIDIIAGIVSIILQFVTKYNPSHSTLVSGLITALAFVLVQPLLLCDISYLYHSFRGQSTLKLYGLMFAFQIVDKILTLAAKYVLTRRKQVKFIQLVMLFGLMLLQAYAIYLQFIVYILVLNSTMGNFVIFCFVTNLTKLKSTVFKKYEPSAYVAQLNYDSKDRMQKVIYVILFLLSQPHRTIPQLQSKLLMLFVLGALIQHIKHGTLLLLAAKQHTLIKLRVSLFASHYKPSCTPTIDKCLALDFPLIPFAAFIIKMLSVVLSANQDHSTQAVFVIYILLCAIILALKTIIIAVFIAHQRNNSDKYDC